MSNMAGSCEPFSVDIFCSGVLEIQWRDEQGSM